MSDLLALNCSNEYGSYGQMQILCRCTLGHPLAPQESLQHLSALAGGTKYIHGVRCDLCGVSSRHRVPSIYNSALALMSAAAQQGVSMHGHSQLQSSDPLQGAGAVFSYHCQPCGYDLCPACANEELGLGRNNVDIANNSSRRDAPSVLVWASPDAETGGQKGGGQWIRLRLATEQEAEGSETSSDEQTQTPAVEADAESQAVAADGKDGAKAHQLVGPESSKETAFPVVVPRSVVCPPNKEQDEQGKRSMTADSTRMNFAVVRGLWDQFCFGGFFPGTIGAAASSRSDRSVWNPRRAYGRTWVIDAGSGRFVREHDRRFVLAQQVQEQGSFFSKKEKRKHDLIRARLEELAGSVEGDRTARAAPDTDRLHEAGADVVPGALKMEDASSSSKESDPSSLSTPPAVATNEGVQMARSANGDGDRVATEDNDSNKEGAGSASLDAVVQACFAIDGVRSNILSFAMDVVFPVQFLLLNASLWSREFAKWILEDGLLWQNVALHVFPTANPLLTWLNFGYVKRRLLATWLFRDVPAARIHGSSAAPAAARPSSSVAATSSSSSSPPLAQHAVELPAYLRSGGGAALSQRSEAAEEEGAPSVGSRSPGSAAGRTRSSRSTRHGTSPPPSPNTVAREHDTTAFRSGNADAIFVSAAQRQGGSRQGGNSVSNDLMYQHPQRNFSEQRPTRYLASHAIENCDEAQCPMAWESLQFQSRESEHIRVCQHCRQDVYYSEDIENAMAHVRRNHKFAVGSAQHRYQDGISKCCRAHLRNNVR